MVVTAGSVCLMCVCVWGAYGKTLCRSAVSHTRASQIELALTAHSSRRVDLYVHSGHEPFSNQACVGVCVYVCACGCVCVRERARERNRKKRGGGTFLPEIN